LRGSAQAYAKANLVAEVREGYPPSRQDLSEVCAGIDRVYGRL